MIGGLPDQTGSEPVTIGRYAVLTMDERALLIPQHQLHALEPAIDVQRSEAEDAGWIAVAGVNWPVYCLSEDLRPIREAPVDRHICVLLESGAGLLGVLSDQVVLLEQMELEILPLPRCMRTAGTPLQGLVLHAERVLCVTSANNLLDCVGLQRAPTDKSDPLQRLPGSAS